MVPLLCWRLCKLCLQVCFLVPSGGWNLPSSHGVGMLNVTPSHVNWISTRTCWTRRSWKRRADKLYAECLDLRTFLFLLLLLCFFLLLVLLEMIELCGTLGWYVTLRYVNQLVHVQWSVKQVLHSTKQKINCPNGKGPRLWLHSLQSWTGPVFPPLLLTCSNTASRKSNFAMNQRREKT